MKRLTTTLGLILFVLLGSATGRQSPAQYFWGPCHDDERMLPCVGTHTYANGDEFVGDWMMGMPNGRGTYTYANGDKYVGFVRDNKPHGQGTATSADGIKVVGEFRHGTAHGQVTYTHPNGNKYVGEFKDNKPHGQGTYTYADGSVDKGIWDPDKFKYAQKVSPTQKQPEQSPSNFPLDKAEKKCAEIGFTKGTEKYGDCVMKLLN